MINDESELYYYNEFEGITFADLSTNANCVENTVMSAYNITAYNCLDSETGLYEIIFAQTAYPSLVFYFADGDYFPNMNIYWDGTDATFYMEASETTTTTTLLSIF